MRILSSLTLISYLISLVGCTYFTPDHREDRKESRKAILQELRNQVEPRIGFLQKHQDFPNYVMILTR